MDLREYQHHVGGIGFGKRLPTAIYLYRGDGLGDCGNELNDLLARLGWSLPTTLSKGNTAFFRAYRAAKTHNHTIIRHG